VERTSLAAWRETIGSMGILNRKKNIDKIRKLLGDAVERARVI
jgi:hypothetical protein